MYYSELSSDEKAPVVKPELVEYLENIYTMDLMLDTKCLDNAERAIGYMEGVRDVISRLRMLSLGKE